jgi:hypothetical protein
VADGLVEGDGLGVGLGLCVGFGLGDGDGNGTPPSRAPTRRSRSDTRHSRALSAVRPSEVKTNTMPMMTSVLDLFLRRCLPFMKPPPYVSCGAMEEDERPNTATGSSRLSVP